jgi:deazaflavin-dependent oxidoreductase (nitroreductase family)
MYRGGRPNRLARILNRISAVHFASGRLAPGTWVTLEVVGRRSGRIVSCPLVVTVHRDERFLVSMLGRRANWVANVRAAGGVAVLAHGVREPVHLIEVEAGERPPILRRFVATAPGARPHVPVGPNAPLEEFSAIAADYPVFRVAGRSASQARPVED